MSNIKRDLEFEERLYNENDIRGRVRLIIISSAILYLSFLVLDKIYSSPLFLRFLFIRLIVVAAHPILLIGLGRAKTSRGCANIAKVLALLDVGGIAIMTWFQNSYVQGLYIIIIGLVVAVPLTFRDTILLYVMIWLSYAIPSSFNLPSVGWLTALYNTFFLTSLILIGALGSFVMDRLRRRELRSRSQLEEMTAKL